MSARVRFGPHFMGRLGRLVGRLRSLSARREGPGNARLTGAGEEFVGHRPWRPGEDTRHIDWNLFARFEQPFVRLFEREAAEHWAVLLDTSASMDVGDAGDAKRGSKLQLAAELVLGLAALALEAGARLSLVSTCGLRFSLRRPHELAALKRRLEGLGAPGEGLEGLLGGESGGRLARLGRAGRVVVIGDLLGLEPRDVLELAAPGRELIVLQVLAAVELVPSEVLFGEGEPLAELEGAEGGRRLLVGPDQAHSYEKALEVELESWQQLLSRHRALWRLAEAGGRRPSSFEDVLVPLLDGARS